MEFSKLTELELPAAFDAHVHLRDGEMAQLITPTIRQGGVNQVYVMVRFCNLLVVDFLFFCGGLMKYVMMRGYLR